MSCSTSCICRNFKPRSSMHFQETKATIGEQFWWPYCVEPWESHSSGITTLQMLETQDQWWSWRTKHQQHRTILLWSHTLRAKNYREISADKTPLPVTVYYLESKSFFFLFLSNRRDRKDRARKLSECHLQKKQAKKISSTTYFFFSV